MDSATVGALSGLSTALGALLPPSTDPAFSPLLSLATVDVKPSGLGGFVGFAHDPEGEIIGRQVEADAVVTARAATLQALNTAVDGMVSAVLAADRPTLRAQGLLRIALSELGPLPDTSPFARDLRFHVLYEFIQLPTSPAGVIERIPLDLETGRGRARTVIDATFEAAGALDLFQVVDDPRATTSAPSAWTHNLAEARIQQTSRIRGGSTTVTPNKPGTYLLLRTTPTLPAVRDFSLRVAVAAGAVGGVGVVFRYQNDRNFYFFLMDNRREFRMLGKKVNGNFLAWDTPAVDPTQSFALDEIVQLRVSMEGPVAQVFLDGERVLEGRDASFGAAGRVGFMSRDIAAAFFHRINLSQW